MLVIQINDLYHPDAPHSNDPSPVRDILNDDGSQDSDNDEVRTQPRVPPRQEESKQPGPDADQNAKWKMQQFKASITNKFAQTEAEARDARDAQDAQDAFDNRQWGVLSKMLCAGRCTEEQVH